LVKLFFLSETVLLVDSRRFCKATNPGSPNRWATVVAQGIKTAVKKQMIDEGKNAFFKIPPFIKTNSLRECLPGILL
jgi:hypothetical protein